MLYVPICPNHFDADAELRWAFYDIAQGCLNLSAEQAADVISLYTQMYAEIQVYKTRLSTRLGYIRKLERLLTRSGISF